MQCPYCLPLTSIFLADQKPPVLCRGLFYEPVPKGCGQLRIKAEGAPDCIKISISDDGPGITPENLDVILEPFYSTKEVGNGTVWSSAYAMASSVNTAGNCGWRASPATGLRSTFASLS